jgi:hypothetical protein
MITYCHTLVRPGYCPFCLGGETLPANQRIESWSRDHKLWNHVKDHLRGCCWPLICPHPSCDTSLENETSFQFHLMDDHRFSRTCPGHILSDMPEEPCSGESIPNSADTQGDSTRKRKPTDDKYTLTWTPPISPGTAGPLKKARTTSPTVCPSLVFNLDTAIDCHSPWAGFTERSPSTEPCLFNSMHGSSAVNDASLNLECRPEMPPFSAPSSADGALSDNSVFSEFIRSPSPTCLSSATVDHGDNLIDLTANDTPHCNLSTADDRSSTYNPLQGDEILDKKKGLRLRLRVGAPKPRITLRVTEPAAKD